MARKNERGISYFPMNADHFSNKKIKLLLIDCGPEGYVAFMRILCEAYKSNGYFFDLNDPDFIEIFCSDDLKLSREKFDLLIQSAVNRGLFNRELFERFGVLTSRRMQINFIEATKRRAFTGKINPKWSLIKDDAEPASGQASSNLHQTATETTGNVAESSGNVDINPQSRVDKSRVDKSRVDTTTDVNNSSENVADAETVERTEDNIRDFFRSHSKLKGEKEQAMKEASRFIAYNEDRRWKKGKTQVNWMDAAEQWIERIHPGKKGPAKIETLIQAGQAFMEERKRKSSKK